jgi:hypothetical protein
MGVCQVWLEQQFTFDGKRRKKRYQIGLVVDSTFGFFMRKIVGISQQPITGNLCFTAISAYLKELFPDFLKHDPFEEPEYYAYPFKHVTLDHMFFVYMCHDRMEMLRYADEREMDYLDFVNWATNHVLSYNEEVGEEIYCVTSARYMWPFIKNKDYTRTWRESLFDFEEV